MIEIDNKQLYNFTRNQTQVFLTAKLGDGCISKNRNNKKLFYSTNCKYLEYIEFKKQLLGRGNTTLLSHNGYSQTPIYTLNGGAWENLDLFNNMSLKDRLDNLDTLGLALWFYDDGSFHKHKNFYNLNTQSFTKEEHEEILIPYFKSLGINAKLNVDNNKQHVLYYLHIGKYDGAYEISELLKQYPINCYSYKLWSSETIQQWSKLQEKLKSEALNIKDLSNFQIGKILKSLN